MTLRDGDTMCANDEAKEQDTRWRGLTRTIRIGAPPSSSGQNMQVSKQNAAPLHHITATDLASVDATLQGGPFYGLECCGDVW